MVRFRLSSKTTAIGISLWIGYTVLETERKTPGVLGWQLKGWSSSNRDGEAVGGVGWKTMILAELSYALQGVPWQSSG